jgi:hypothetical protein
MKDGTFFMQMWNLQGKRGIVSREQVTENNEQREEVVFGL